MNKTIMLVESLNAEIEAIQKKREKAITQKEMLLSRLEAELKKYEEKYGVALRGSNFDEVYRNISSEKEEVYGGIRFEYELKSKVVQAIERGDIAEAEKLLKGSSFSEVDGVNDVSDVKDAIDVGSSESIGDRRGTVIDYPSPDSIGNDSEAPTGNVFKESESASYEGALSQSKRGGTSVSIGSVSHLNESNGSEVVDEFTDSDEIVFGTDSDEVVAQSSVIKVSGSDFGDFSLDDEDSSEDDSDVKGYSSNEGESNEDNNPFTLDDLDDDFGFGEILKGTKFDTN